MIYGEIQIELDEARIVRGQQSFELAPREVEALRYLLERAGSTVTREELEREVWGFRAGVVSEAVPVCIRRLRQKLEADPAEPRILVTVRGVGWTVLPPQAEPRPLLPRLFGRERELAWLVEALQRGVPLITLLGPPGVGKSRLAHELKLVRVSLSGARDPEDVDALVARALGVSELVPERALRGRGVLLDECEHAREAVAERVERWLSEAAGLQIVATSRLPLGLPAEQRLPLGPLALDSGVELLLDRARRLDPSFQADPSLLQTLVTALDSLPLAIELAAASVGLVGVEGWLGLLARAPVRELEAALERSFRLLSCQIHDALLALSVFEGPFDLSDAAAVLAAEAPEALAQLRVLAEQGLLRATGADFCLFAAVRHRARAELAPDSVLWDRHAAWFARLGDLERPDPLERLQRALPELRAARARTKDAEIAGRCAVAMAIWLRSSGRTQEVLALAEDAAGASPVVRVALATLASQATGEAHDLIRAIALAEDALPLAAVCSPIVQGRLRVHLAYACFVHEPDSARAVEALAPLRPLAARLGPIEPRYRLLEALIARSEEGLLEAARLARLRGDAHSEARGWVFLCDRATDDGRWARAAWCAEQGLAALECEQGTARARLALTVKLAALHIRRGEADRAALRLEEVEGLSASTGADVLQGGWMWPMLAAVRGELPQALAGLEQQHWQLGRRPASGYTARYGEFLCALRAEVLLRLGEAQRARDLLVEPEPRSPRARSMLALALSRCGQPAQAEAMLLADVQGLEREVQVLCLAVRALVTGSAEDAREARVLAEPLELTSAASLSAWLCS